MRRISVLPSSGTICSMVVGRGAGGEGTWRPIRVLTALLCLCVLAPAAAAEDAAPPKPAEKSEKPQKTPDVVYVPTPNDVVAKMLETAGVTKHDVLYDLGCGDGRIVVTAARRFGCKAVGYEIVPERVAEGRASIKKNGLEALARIEQEDIFTLDLSQASVVTLYLLPKLNVRLIPQLEKLKPGARIVSHDFDMQGVKPDKVLKIKSKEDNVEHTIYLWTTPLKKVKVDAAVAEEEEEEEDP